MVAQPRPARARYCPAQRSRSVKVARVSAEATAGVAPPGGAQRDGDAEAAAGAPSGGGSDVRDGAGGSGAGAAGASARRRHGSRRDRRRRRRRGHGRRWRCWRRCRCCWRCRGCRPRCGHGRGLGRIRHCPAQPLPAVRAGHWASASPAATPSLSLCPWPSLRVQRPRASRAPHDPWRRAPRPPCRPLPSGPSGRPWRRRSNRPAGCAFRRWRQTPARTGGPGWPTAAHRCRRHCGRRPAAPSGC